MAALTIGSRDRPIEILEATQGRAEGSGEVVESWMVMARVWAQVLPGAGSEAYGEQQRVATTVKRFKVLFLDGVTPLNRVRYQGRDYDIHDVQEIGRREGLEILAEARAE